MSAPPPPPPTPPPPPPPPPPRQRTSQSPSPTSHLSHPQPTPPIHPPQPRPRLTPYPPRYFRPPAVPPTSTPILGWTPRTPAAPHTPVSNRSAHAMRPMGRALHIGAIHPPSLTVQPPVQSPRMSPNALAAAKAAAVGKPGIVPLPAPMPTTVPAAHTPSWLKGSYRPQSVSAVPQPTTVENWCTERLEAIKTTVEGKSNAVPELRKVMEDLDSAKVLDEITLVGTIRKDYWKARERQRKAAAELKRTEREVQRIEMHSAHIDGKINRLRSYARFIEGGWKDESTLESTTGNDDDKNGDNANDDAQNGKGDSNDDINEQAKEKEQVEQGHDGPVSNRELPIDASKQLTTDGGM